jgi:two-component system cell cycle response regulator
VSSIKRILIVDDIADCRELLAIFFRRIGYDVDEAPHAEVALEKAHSAAPDLIIMDLGLPGMTGDQATACLKADPLTSNIPVLVYTGFHLAAAPVRRAIEAGAEEILQKPIAFAVLQKVVEKYLHRVPALRKTSIDAAHFSSP